jgi:Amt family ammonium transporter
VSSPLAGLFYGGGFGVLKAQIIGSATVTAAALGGGLALMYLVKATGTLRVSAEGELEGLDVHEHGTSAYPEYMISGSESVMLSVTPKEEVAA